MKAYRMQVDANQKEIVEKLRKMGYEVVILGQPLDLLVSNASEMWLVEVKSKGGKINEKQEKFILKWRGKPIIIGRSFEEILGELKR